VTLTDADTTGARRPAPVRLFPLPDYYCSHYKQGEAVQSYLETIVPRV
jgi:hypothetical protein